MALDFSTLASLPRPLACPTELASRRRAPAGGYSAQCRALSPRLAAAIGPVRAPDPVPEPEGEPLPHEEPKPSAPEKKPLIPPVEPVHAPDNAPERHPDRPPQQEPDGPTQDPNRPRPRRPWLLPGKIYGKVLLPVGVSALGIALMVYRETLTQQLRILSQAATSAFARVLARAGTRAAFTRLGLRAAGGVAGVALAMLLNSSTAHAATIPAWRLRLYAAEARFQTSANPLTQLEALRSMFVTMDSVQGPADRAFAAATQATASAWSAGSESKRGELEAGFGALARTYQASAARCGETGLGIADAGLRLCDQVQSAYGWNPGMVQQVAYYRAVLINLRARAAAWQAKAAAMTTDAASIRRLLSA